MFMTLVFVLFGAAMISCIFMNNTYRSPWLTQAISRCLWNKEKVGKKEVKGPPGFSVFFCKKAYKLCHLRLDLKKDVRNLRSW